MLKWAIIFAVIALVAGVLGFGGVAAGAAGIAKILFVLFLIVAAVMLVLALMGGKAVSKNLEGRCPSKPGKPPEGGFPAFRGTARAGRAHAGCACRRR